MDQHIGSEAPLTKALDLTTLRTRLEAAGAFRRRAGATWAKFAALLTIGFALMLVPAFTVPWLFWALLPVSALFLTAAIMIGHEGGHRSLSSGRAQNEAILYLAFPLLSGLSAEYWKNKHNVKHHTQPNIDGVDDDLDLWPMAGSRRQHEASGPFRRFLQRKLQAWLFWPLSSLLSISMRYSAIAYLVRSARAGRVGASWFVDALCVATHYALWIAVPLMMGLSGLATLGVYMAFWGIVSVYLTAIFAPAHMGLPIYRSHDDTWRLQLEVTRNLHMPRWLSFFFIGLDHQVEHHLFMRMPHQNMKLASPIVKQWAREQGVPYQEINFFRALVDVTRFVKHAWRHDTPAVRTREEPEPVEERLAA